MSGKKVTLYIDDVSIRLMVTRGKRITKLAEAPLDAALGEIDTKEKEAVLAKNIKKLFKANKVNKRKIILGISGLHCLTRPLVLPELPQAMLKEAITRESRRVLPVSVEQLYLSWKILSLSGNKIYIYVVALSRQLADMVIRILKQAGLKPYLMDIKPLALARLSREPDAMIVDVQAKEFDIINIVDNIPQPIRTVAFPREKLSLPEKIEIVRGDIKRTIQFFNENNADNPIKPGTTMLISGELATAPELYELLAAELGFIPALLESPLKCMKQLDASHYLVNVGLTLKEIPKEAGAVLPNLNALPTPYQPKPISLTQVLALPSVALAVAIVVMLVSSVQNTADSISILSKQVSSNNVSIEKGQSQKKTLLTDISAIQAQIAVSKAEYDIYQTAFIKMNAAGDVMNDVLRTVENQAFTGLSFTTISDAVGQIRIEGNSATETNVLVYVRKLQDSGRFKEITILNITRIENTGTVIEETGGSIEVSDTNVVYYTYQLMCYIEDSEL
jgi:Tfp pilus assembly PilM family ATPase